MAKHSCSITDVQTRIMIDWFETISDSEKLKYIEESPFLIAYMKRPHKHLQVAAVNGDPFSIMFIDRPYKDVKFLAALLKESE